MRWDIFCNVVDNLGDIGVCWRLSRQLAAEHGARVRLWVSDLETFRLLAPSIKPGVEIQRLGEIEVRHWTVGFPQVEPAEVVVETFACTLPASYIAAMAVRPEAPVWINLEYLSAESWVDDCHALPSPQPFRGLTKHFFFPGFTARTGGVLIERGLAQRRHAFQSDPAQPRRFLSSLGVPAGDEDEMRVSLFCYPQAPVADLLAAWVRDGRRLHVLAFAGTASADALAAQGLTDGATRGALRASILPFLSQDDYDRILWACDWNFVRGEDSFVRAQLAARPCVWQAYPQEADAHALKIEAFLQRYCEPAGPGYAADLGRLWAAWNGLGASAGLAQAWPACAGQGSEVAVAWAAHLESLGDLAGNLARFCRERL